MHNEQCAVYSSKQLSGKQLSGLQAGEYSCMRANCAQLLIVQLYYVWMSILKSFNFTILWPILHLWNQKENWWFCMR